MFDQRKAQVTYKRIMKKTAGYFLQGLMYAAPLGITIYFIYKAFNFVDDIFKPYLKEHIGITIPGLGLIMVVLAITILGIIGQSVIAQPFKMLIERLVKRTPLLNIPYSFLRDFMEAFVGKEKKFNKPVRVIVSRDPEIERFGFITQDDLTELGITGKVAVYLPWSYTFTGELQIFPTDCVTPVDMPPGEWMKFILSGGVTRV